MKIFAASLSITAAAIAAISLTSLPERQQFTFAASYQSYSCASIHFGMNDDTYAAMTYDCSTATTNLANYHSIDNVSIKSITCSNVYAGGTYTAQDTSYSQYAIRVGKSKGIGSITITFDQQIVGCTIYALQYASDPVIVSVNGQETALENAAASVTKANAAALRYDAYSFTFDATDTLIVKSKQASKTVSGKSVSASRFYLANIALRVSL